jgi:hypothetical protein
MDADRVAANLHLDARDDGIEPIITPRLEVPRRDECSPDCGQPSPERTERRQGIAFEAAEGGSMVVANRAETCAHAATDCPPCRLLCANSADPEETPFIAVTFLMARVWPI